MHFDLPSQDQPGDSEEVDMREEWAIELARRIRRYPARHIPLRRRVQTLSGLTSEAELDRLVPEVDYFLGLHDWQRRA
jgi:hypothetical protein